MTHVGSNAMFGPDVTLARTAAASTCNRALAMSVGCARSVFASFESFPLQSFEIADGSLVEGTIAVRNYRFLFGSPRNGI
jgi:hypothetical protein